MLDDLVPISAHHPLIIAGPCSAESEEQVVGCARQLAGGGVHIFRAGLWKPRTHPGGFEGVGATALPWMRQAKACSGLPVATEVATPAHVAEALDGGIDVLWLGARTTSGTFAVQQVADAIAAHHRSDVAVLVKNPVGPDVELWLGALQRLHRAGVRRLAAVHRGFTTAAGSVYRNDPQWQIPIELKRREPGLPVLVDPSHMAGRRDLVPVLAQQALDMGFDGLMMECHPHPDCALSDAAQQLTPHDLLAMLQTLSIRKASTGSMQQQLAMLRTLIDQTDGDLLAALARRMEVVRQIGQLKREAAMPIVQTERYRQLLERRIAQARELGLSPEFVAQIFQLVHQEAVTQQLD